MIRFASIPLAIAILTSQATPSEPSPIVGLDGDPLPVRQSGDASPVASSDANPVASHQLPSPERLPPVAPLPAGEMIETVPLPPPVLAPPQAVPATPQAVPAPSIPIDPDPAEALAPTDWALPDPALPVPALPDPALPAPALHDPERLMFPPGEELISPLPTPAVDAPYLDLNASNSVIENRGAELSVAGDRWAGIEGCGCDGGVCTGDCLQQTVSIASHWTPWRRLHEKFADQDWSRLRIGKLFRRHRSRDLGIGYERVMFAPNVLDTAITVPHVAFRYQADSGLRFPNRAEYVWGGQRVETSLNHQDLHVRLAVGNRKAMALTQYTLRSLDPDIAPNTTGMGDMVVGAQALLRDGKRTKVASIFRTYLATGPSDRGLGTGNTALEPGLLVRHCRSAETYWFGELKYWMPLKGTPDIRGDVMTAGLGVSTIAAESDVFAFIPTFETRVLTFFYGGETRVDGSTRRIDGITAVELYPGARFVLGPESDLGLWELGFAAGVTVADRDWYDTRFVIDLRLSH